MEKEGDERSQEGGGDSQPIVHEVSFSKNQSHRITGSSEPQDNSQSYNKEKENTTSENVT